MTEILWILDKFIECCITAGGVFWLLDKITKMYHEYIIERYINKGRFAGVQWQKDFFISAINIPATDKAQKYKVENMILSGVIKGWTEEDLLKYYNKPMIYAFYTCIYTFVYPLISQHNHDERVEPWTMEGVLTQFCPDDMIRFLEDFNILTNHDKK